MKTTNIVKHTLCAFLCLILFIIVGHDKAGAVVPPAVSLEPNTQEQTKEQRLEAIIEKLENQVQQNTEFLKEIKAELKQLNQKDKGLKDEATGGS